MKPRIGAGTVDLGKPPFPVGRRNVFWHTYFRLEYGNNRKFHSNIYVIEHTASHYLFIRVGCDGDGGCDKGVDAHDEHTRTSSKAG